jgi:hypothetical protein
MGRYAFAICLPDHTAILLDFKLAMQMLTGSRSGSSALGRPFTIIGDTAPASAFLSGLIYDNDSALHPTSPATAAPSPSKN